MDNDFLLEDRLTKIRETINKYGEENFYISFSGGKDSTVLSWLVDMALPENKIPRVFSNTGIELKMIVNFVKRLAESDERFIILKPTVNIRKMLEENGYPFKSKFHSRWVSDYWKRGGKHSKTTNEYVNNPRWHARTCPNILKYQFEEKPVFQISDKCCNKLKKEPLHKWQKENNRPVSIIGLMVDEGGRREDAKCTVFKGDKLKAFQPLTAVSKEWEDWLIETYDIDICPIYRPPYNFKRTGCKGCPFNLNLQKSLDTLYKFFPSEAKQCELIWKPVYDEYRRLGYRLRRNDQALQLTFDDMEVMN